MTGQLRILMFVLIYLACQRPCFAQQSQPDNSALKVKPPAASPSKLVEQAIIDLGSPSFLVREKASRQLWNAGSEAQAALEKAMSESDDFEVVTRARQIVTMFHLGIYPDTPRETVAQITNFRMGNLLDKRRIALELLNSGKRDLIRRLIELEPNRRAREQLSRLVPLALGIEGSAASRQGAGVRGQTDIGLAVRMRLAQRSFTSAERMLRNSTGDDMTRDYAALLLSRGKLDATIAQLRGKLGPADRDVQRQLAWMLRANGDLTGAVAAAKAAKDDTLVETLHIESGDWKELAKLDIKFDLNESALPADELQKLARIITYRHLAGDKRACDAAVAAAIARLKQLPQVERKLLDALILNDRSDQVLAACAAQKPTIAFDILVSQNRLQDAFRRVKIDVPLAAGFDWKSWLKDGGADVNLERRFLAHHVIRALYRVGETERAGELVAAILAVVKEHLSEPQWQQEGQILIDVAALSARPEACDELAAKLLALKLEIPDRVISGLYRYQNPIAVAAWIALRKQLPGEDQASSLRRLRRLLSGNRDAKSVEEFTVLLPHIEAELATGNATAAGAESADARAGKLLALAALLQRYDQTKLSAKYLARISATEVSSQILVEQGNLYAEEKFWSEAIRAYDAAWTKDRRNASALYLLGWAQSKHGEDAQGRQQIEIALIISLGEGDSRRLLARTLARLHVDEEAARQRQLVLRLAAPHESSVVQALDEMCAAAVSAENAMKTGTPGLALLSQRLSAEFLLTRDVFLTETRYYVQWRAFAHRIAAREMLRAGKTAAAIEEIRRAEAIMPEDVQIALDCDGDLRKLHAGAEADALYRRIADRLQADCRVFPRYATCRNDLAWMAANLDRDLDMALANAQRAVELAPQSAGILDTLAEVQFRRGNRAQAIQLARRCIELDGDGPLYKERLARFER
jgi:hypothetical protein